MPKTRLEATQYIARALGAEGNTTQLAAALDALYAAIQEWNLKRDWNFLLMDTRDGFAVAGCSNAAGAVTTTTTDGFAGVNIGTTFTVTDGAPAGTYTVSAIVSTTAITVTGGGGNFSTESLTFSGDILTVIGTEVYNLPAPFKRPYTARIVGGTERTLGWKDQREYDRLYQEQSTGSQPEWYNLFNPSTFTQARQTGKIRLLPTPSTVETLRVRFFRPIAEPAATGTYLDVPDRYVYALLEAARWHYLKNHDAETARLQMTEQKASELYQRCAVDDEGETEDRDVCMIANIDHSRPHVVVSDEMWGWP
jgi:hypothetical protein